MRMRILYNKKWENNTPNISIITPVYNRRKELARAIASVKKQTYIDFEHIIINDGSSEQIDDIVIDYMENVNFPVAYIIKSNGGVHTARNAGIKISRGQYIQFLDSDDELTENCLDFFIQAWESIPAESRKDYWEVTAFCEDQNGNRIGGHLPKDINQLPFNEARKFSQAVELGEKIGNLRGDLMRSHPWPEPENVTFVSEAVNWLYFCSKYKSWYLDDVVRIYHRETDISYTNNGNKRTNQQIINQLYNHLWIINNGNCYGIALKTLISSILRYCVMKHVLYLRKVKINNKWYNNGVTSKKWQLLTMIFWFPSLILSIIYNHKYTL